MWMRVLIGTVCLAMAGSTGFAGEKIEPVLASNAAVERILSELGDNTAALLLPASVVGDFGPIARAFKLDRDGPRGRDFTIKMAWMPDRKRAFFCGANHGSPHRLNDAWEYDLPSNTWVMLYDPDYNDAGDRPKNLAAAGVTLKDGVLVTARGGPVHVAHTWWGLTYDPELKAAVWMNVWPGYGMKEKLAHVRADEAQLYKGPPLWAFFPAHRKWQPIPSKEPYLKRVGLAGSLQYIPELGGSLWYQRDNGTWLFDSKTNGWRDLKPEMNGLSAIGTIENVTCYDARRKVLVAHRGDDAAADGGHRWAVKRTYHYDVAKNAWSLTVEAKDGPVGHDARTSFYYDPVGGACLLFEHARKKIWAYDVEAKRWTELTPHGAAIPDWPQAIGYFDEARNVLVINEGKDTWVYRFKRARDARPHPR
jgi:hypothetical protein